MSPEYTLVFTPRYGAEAGTFTLTGDIKALAYELIELLESLKLSVRHWRIKENEDNRALIIEQDGKIIFLVDNPSILHDIAFTWCSLEGKHVVHMYDARHDKNIKNSNERTGTRS